MSYGDTISETSFEEDNKPVKRDLEKSLTRPFMKGYGDTLLLTGPALKAHYDVFGNFLRKNDRFFVVEKEKKVIEKQVEDYKLINDTRIKLYEGDLFSVFKVLEKHYEPSFIYIHLDFCITAWTLMAETLFFKNMLYLAKSPALRDKCYIDITFSARGDGQRFFKSMMETIIPEIFIRAKWYVSNPRRVENFTFTYRDARQTPMVNALYQLDRDAKKKANTTNAYFAKSELLNFIKNNTKEEDN